MKTYNQFKEQGTIDKKQDFDDYLLDFFAYCVGFEALNDAIECDFKIDNKKDNFQKWIRKELDSYQKKLISSEREEIVPTRSTKSKKGFERQKTRVYLLLLIFISGMILMMKKDVIETFFHKKEKVNSSNIPEVKKIGLTELDEIFEAKDSDTFKLLILPFKERKECKEEKTDYISPIIERYKQMKSIYNLKMEIQYFKHIDSTYTPSHISTILNHSTIDLVIWGIYEDECEEKSRLIINHAPISPVRQKGMHIRPERFLYKSTGLNEIKNTDDLRTKELLKAIDKIIYWRVASFLMKKDQFAKAKKIISNYQKQGFDSDYRFLDCVMAMRNEEYAQLEKYAKEIISDKFYGKSDSRISNQRLTDDFEKHTENIKEDVILLYSWLMLIQGSGYQKDSLSIKMLELLEKHVPKAIIPITETSETTIGGTDQTIRSREVTKIIELNDSVSKYEGLGLVEEYVISENGDKELTRKIKVPFVCYNEQVTVNEIIIFTYENDKLIKKFKKPVSYQRHIDDFSICCIEKDTIPQQENLSKKVINR